MIVVTIKEFVSQKGVTTAYQLQKALNLQPAVAYSLWEGDMSRIGFSTLDRLCGFFSCQPDAFLRYVPESAAIERKKLNGGRSDAKEHAPTKSSKGGITRPPGGGKALSQKKTKVRKR